jgi:hypothetical protein
MAIVKIADCGKGVNLDLTPEELQTGMWSDCTNMRFKDGYAQRFNGLARIFDVVTHSPHYVAPYQTSTKRYWVSAGNAKVYVDDGVTRTEITRLTEIAMSGIARTSAVLATVTTSAAHGLTTGNVVQIYNTVPTQFNGEALTITVTSGTTFTYALAADPGVSATTVGRLIGPGAAFADFTGARDNRWSGGTFGGILIMNNGLALPQFWLGNTSKLRSLTAWSTLWRCDFIVPFKQYLVAFGITKSGVKNPHMMKWSVAAVPGALPASWDSTDPKLDAGEVDIAETPDLLIDAMPLGDALIVYKERSMYSVRFVGQPFIFQVQRIPGETGMLFRGCGVSTPLGHVVLTSGDVVLNNGQGAQSIADGWVRKYIFNNIDSTNYKRAFVTSNPQKNEVLICIPFAGSEDCDQAVVWNWKDKTWGLRTLYGARFGNVGQIDEITQGTWSSDSETWSIDATTWNEDEYSPNESRLILAETSRLVAFDVSNSDDGTNALSGTLERIGLWLDDAQLIKLLRGLQMRIDAPAGSVVTVRLGSAMVPDSPAVWGSPMTFTVGTDFKVDGFAQGRYLAMQITCSAPWRLRALDMDVIGTGRF